MLRRDFIKVLSAVAVVPSVVVKVIAKKPDIDYLLRKAIVKANEIGDMDEPQIGDEIFEDGKFYVYDGSKWNLVCKYVYYDNNWNIPPFHIKGEW